MHQSRVLKPFVMAVGMAVLTFPSFAHTQPVNHSSPQLPGSGEMETTDRTGTTGPSGSEAFSTDDEAVDVIGRMAKPAGDYAATDTDRDLAAHIRVAVQGDPALARLIDRSFHIVVDNGAVTLQGKVRDAHAKEQINAKVKATAGSHPVENKLVIAQQ